MAYEINPIFNGFNRYNNKQFYTLLHSFTQSFTFQMPIFRVGKCYIEHDTSSFNVAPAL